LAVWSVSAAWCCSTYSTATTGWRRGRSSPRPGVRAGRRAGCRPPATQLCGMAAARRRPVPDRQLCQSELRPVRAGDRAWIAARRPVRVVPLPALLRGGGDPGVLPALVLPDRPLLSPRWRPVVWSGAAFVVLAVVGNGLQPEVEPLPGLRPIHNPLVYLPAAKPLVDLSIGAAAAVCSLVGIGGAVTAPVVRFRRARGIERQQLKWRRSAFASATRSTWIRSRASCWPWSIRRWNRPGCRCGCDRRRRAPGTPPVDVYEVVAQWPAWGNGPDPRPGWSAKVWMRLSIRCRGRRRDRKGMACPYR
jgi:hypothetical protein